MANERSARKQREIVQFGWRVPSGGFRWIDGLAGPDSNEPSRFLVPSQAVGIRDLKLTRLPPSPEQVLGSPAERLQALDDLPSTLFRTFASTPATEAGILGFANEFGNLGGSCAKAFCLTEMASANGPRALTGEPLGAWEKQIWLMGQAIALWEAYTASGDKQLSKLLETEEFEVRGYAITLIGLRKQEVPLDWELRLQMPVEKPIRVRDAAKELLDRIISPELEELRMRSSGLALIAAPGSLRSFLWYQLVRSIGNNARHLRCETCGGWYEPRTRRADVKYCSARCQMRAYRIRKEASLKVPPRGKKRPK